MQVIFLEHVGSHNLGDVAKVKQGFARNWLIPQGKAKRATKENLAEFEARRAELERQQSDKLGAAKARAEQLEGQTVQVTQKAGVDGRLFGSVTNTDIAEAFMAKGMPVSKGEVRLPDGPLKHTGDHAVTLALHAEVIASITVQVVGEQ